MKRFLSILLLLFMMNHGLSAHEYWFEPLSFTININEKLKAHEKVGAHFKGNEYAYLSTSYESLNIFVGNQIRPIKSRLGDLPAVNELVEDQGLAILSAITTPSDLIYKTNEKFLTFLKNQGLEWVAKRHIERGLPEKGFKEIYRRYPKSLIKVGHGQGNDKSFGLPLELVLETNPYTELNGTIKVRLLWEGRPLTNKRVNIFNRVFRGNNRILVVSKLTETHLITDAEGRIEIPRANGGIFLISAAHMIEPTEKVKQKTDAVWESLWASTTYEIEQSKN